MLSLHREASAYMTPSWQASEQFLMTEYLRSDSYKGTAMLLLSTAIHTVGQQYVQVTKSSCGAALQAASTQVFHVEL